MSTATRQEISDALRSPTDSELTRHMMERHDARDAAVMELMLGVPRKCWGAFCADVEAGRQPW